ncbi:MAG TPA: hypothetical protein VKY26_05585 [Actinomycetota bacterium]|nr:hypothetical protein [Actinomycetota bacterium]
MEGGRDGRQVRRGPSRWRWLVGTLLDPVVWVFLLSGTFEVLTGDPTLHATLLFAVAAVLIVDAVRRRVKGIGPVLAVEGSPAAGGGAGGGSEPVAISPRRLSWLWIAVGVLFAVVVGSMRRYTYPVTLTVWLVGAPALVWAWRAPPRHRADKPLPGVGLLAWVGAFVGLAIWELVALSFQPSLSVNSTDHPTFSTLTDPLFAHPAGRMVLLALWLALGWYLVER